MNHAELLEHQQNNTYTDLTLILSDETMKISVNVHKIILSIANTYFKKLFSTFKEKQQNEITITVSNAHVAYDIIMSFYGQTTNTANLPKWYHALEMYKCRNFFGMEQDIRQLNNLVVPEEGFETLLDVIDLIGYNDNTIKMVNKNLPKKYGLTNFPTELLKKMITLTYMNRIIVGKFGEIEIWDIETRELTHMQLEPTDFVDSICTLPDNKIMLCCRKTLKILDTMTYELVENRNFLEHNIGSVCVSRDGKNVLYGNGCNINIRDITTGKLRKKLSGDGYVQSICHSTDEEYIVSGGNEVIVIWNAKTYEEINIIREPDIRIYKICITHDNKRIISCGDDAKIKIWDITTGEKILTLTGHTDDIISIDCSADNKKIVSGSDDKSIKIWDIETGKLMKTINELDYNVTCVYFLPDNMRIISGHDGGNVMIWDIETGILICALESESSMVGSICYSICYSKGDYETYNKIINNISSEQKRDLGIED